MPARFVDSFTFERLVVGRHNAAAHMAAVAVSRGRGYADSPLYIHGEQGMGKTHLTHAIGNSLLRRRHRRVILITPLLLIDAAERMQGAYSSLRASSCSDCVLVDEVSFILNFPDAQVVLHDVVRRARNVGAAVVINDDHHPEELGGTVAGLQQELRSGHVVKVTAPNTETRIKILRQIEADYDTAPLTDSAIAQLAEDSRGSVRRMIGTAIRQLLIQERQRRGGRADGQNETT